MREAKAEIKAIEAQLRSIRVEPSSSQRIPATTLEPTAAHPKSRNTKIPNPADTQGKQQQQTSASSASPRPADFSIHAKPARTQSTQASPSQAGISQAKPQTKRVESYPLPPKHRPPSHLEATIERLQEQSAFYIQQFQQVQAQAFQTPENLLEQTLKILDSQVQHINQLSAIQESALLDLKTIAEQVERDWKTVERNQGIYADELDTPPVCEYLGTAIPQIEQSQDGVYVLTSRSIDLFKAEREAKLTAEALRHWATRKNAPASTPCSPSVWQRLGDLLLPDEADSDAPGMAQGAAQSTHAPSTKTASNRASHRTSRSRRSRSTSQSLLRLKELVALFLGAVVVRAGLDLVLSSFPTLWTPAVALLVTPAAIAVYRSSHTPQSGLIWTYRLLVIMLGLLLGGRL